MPNSLPKYPLFPFFLSKMECFPYSKGSTFLCMRLNHLGGLTPSETGMDDRYEDEKGQKTSARERTITIYTNREEFLPKLNVDGLEIIQIFLLNKKGQILWRSKGEFTKQKGIELEKAINESQ